MIEMSTPTLPDMAAPSPRVRVKCCRRMMGTYAFPLSISAICDAVIVCPKEHYTWLPRQDLLSVKEISYCRCFPFRWGGSSNHRWRTADPPRFAGR